MARRLASTFQGWFEKSALRRPGSGENRSPTARILPRLSYWLRRGLPELSRPAHRSVEYEARLSIDPERGHEILDGAGYYFPLPFAGQNFRVQAAADDRASGHARGLQLSLLVESETTVQSWLMASPAIRRRLEERLRNISARILFYALTGEHRNYAFSSKEYATGHWMRELYASLHPNSFQETSWIPPRALYDRAGNPRFFFQRPRHAALAERRRPPLRRRRRILLIPIRARRSEVEGLLPPPFHARWRNAPEVSSERADLRLYLRVFLDGGALEHPAWAGAPDDVPVVQPGAVFPKGDLNTPRMPELSEYETRRKSGDESGLYMELLCPAQLHADSIRTRGWIPLQARRFPLDRPALPWDALTCSYRIRADGLRFCLGDRKRRLLGQTRWRPARGLRAGEYPPRLARSRPTAIFIQSPDSLDVHVFQESYTAPANRIYILDREPSSDGRRPQASPAQDLCDYLAGRLGIALRPEKHAWFISYADVATLSEQRVPLTECHYRNPRPAVPDLAGFVQSTGANRA
ncbi:MAG: hypothetical protein RIF32_00640 [Leptospirales bacterium]